MKQRLKQFLFATISFMLVLIPIMGAVAEASPTINEYSTSPDSPMQITTGPDGALWYTGFNDTVNRISTSGSITTYTLIHSPYVQRPYDITTGPDGALWFTMTAPNDATAGAIGRITTSGTITVYLLPAGHDPSFITTGSDGALWFTENIGSDNSGMIGRITTSGAITEYPYPSTDPYLRGITSGPDGALWFTEAADGGSDSTGPAIGSITTSGVVTRYPISSPSGIYPAPYSITTGSDGALWFTEPGSASLGRITTSGAITQYPAASTEPFEITTGSDGALWYTDHEQNKVDRMNTSGAVTQYSAPSGSSGNLLGITTGPDGAVWFAEYAASKIGQLIPPAVPSPTYFTSNNGPFSRSTTPYSSGVTTQTVNSDGSITVSVNNAPGYADSGFVLYEGTLGNLPNFTVNGTGDNFGLNLWFDTNNDGDYFAWDGSNNLTSLDGDTYGLSPGSTDDTLSVDDSTQFFMMDDGLNYSLNDLVNGNDTTSGINANTRVAVWIGVDTPSGGSTSATIDSVSGL